jgi:hypothetical protein
VIGGPAITVLMRRYRITGSRADEATPTPVADEVEGRVMHVETDAAREFGALKAIVLLLLVVWAGGWVMKGFAAIGVTMPATIGGMLVGALVRNVDDATGWLRLPVHTLDLIGNASERVLGIALNSDGSIGGARGSNSAYFFSNDVNEEGDLRLQGVFSNGVAGGNGGIALDPSHVYDLANGSNSRTLAFVATVNRSIKIVDTFHFRQRGEIQIRDNIVGPLRAAPPLASENVGLTGTCDEIWVKLHTGDPGSAGTSNAATNATRVQATFGSAAASRAISNTAAVSWTNVSTTETYTHVSLWSASSGGTFLGRDDLSSSAAVTAGDNFSIPIGDLDLTIT